MQTTHPLHEKAVALSKHYLATEAELLVVIQAIDRERVFQRLGYSSLHAYVVGALKLSDSTAYNFISVARKSVAVPELKAAVTKGEILEKTDPVKKAERFTARQVAKPQANPKSRRPSAHHAALHALEAGRLKFVQRQTNNRLRPSGS